MAVLMVCGNVVQVPESVFAPVRTLTANIALEMAYALDLHRSALFASGLVLMLVVAGLVVLTDRWIDAPEY
jgi:phosphate transport system permease protein